MKRQKNIEKNVGEKSYVLNCSVVPDLFTSFPGSSVLGNSPGKNAGLGCHALLQGIFPTQESNPGLPHCRWILYYLNCQGKVL